MPFERLWIGGVDLLDGRGELVVCDRDHEAGLLKLGAHEVCDVAPLVLDSADELDADGLAIEMPCVVDELSPGLDHLFRDDLAGQLRRVADAGAAVDVVDGQEVRIRRAHVRDHRLRRALVDVLCDRIAVDHELHGRSDLRDGERVQLALASRRRVEDQRYRCRRSVDQLYAFGAAQIPSGLGLETEQVEIQVVGFDVQRRTVNEERVVEQAFSCRPRLVVRRLGRRILRQHHRRQRSDDKA
jgi:hypothetical protein